MNMKSITAFAIASIAFAGAACSQASEPETAEVQTISADGTASGTFNLSIPGETSSAGSSGGLNLNLGGSSSETRLIGSGALGGADFGGDAGIDLNLDLDEETATLDALPAVEASTPDDDIIRIEPKK
jgi:hypothetical protein